MIAFNLIAPIELSRAGARARGFSLVEMALVLLIVGLLAAVFLPATNTLLDNNRRKETRAKLEALEQAMVRFVMVNRRLPCPADGDRAPGDANQGLELAVGGACAVQALTNGVVPWRSLGVSQTDAMDAWSTMVSYRVWGGARLPGPSWTLDGGMAVDEDGGEDDNEYGNEYDSHLNMGTRMILIVLCPSFLGPCAWGHPLALGRALGKNLGRATHKVLCTFLLCQCHIVLV